MGGHLRQSRTAKGSGVILSWVPSWALVFAICVTLGKLFNIWDLVLPVKRNGNQIV